MLRLDMKPGQSISIGGHATITLEYKAGMVARLSIQADKSVPISRVEESQTAASIAAKHGITGSNE